MNIELLLLNRRNENCLKENGIKLVADFNQYSLYEISMFRGYGMGSLKKLFSSLKKYGFDLDNIFKDDPCNSFIIENHEKYLNIMHILSDAMKGA